MRSETRDVARWSLQRGIAVVTYEPLANGMLAGAIHAPEDFVRVVGEDYAGWPFWQRLFSPGRFERSVEGITATLAGSRNPTHVRDNASAASITLTNEQRAELDALIPLGPTFG
jgi:aryl-alcohol dehydrogenase-like predicted oxidoreductase